MQNLVTLLACERVEGLRDLFPRHFPLAILSPFRGCDEVVSNLLFRSVWVQGLLASPSQYRAVARKLLSPSTMDSLCSGSWSHLGHFALALSFFHLWSKSHGKLTALATVSFATYLSNKLSESKRNFYFLYFSQSQSSQTHTIIPHKMSIMSRWWKLSMKQDQSWLDHCWSKVRSTWTYK
jgi:hypothetical protein